LKNSEARATIVTCYYELRDISQIIEKNLLDSSNNYLNRYAIIRACGAIESSFKRILADYLINHSNGHIDIEDYLDRIIIKSSTNPALTKIQQCASNISKARGSKYTKKIESINKIELSSKKAALSSLVADRNSFAHGGTPNTSASRTLNYFQQAIFFIKILDEEFSS